MSGTSEGGKKAAETRGYEEMSGKVSHKIG